MKIHYENMCFICDKEWVRTSDKTCSLCEEPNPFNELITKFLENESFADTYYNSLTIEGKKVIICVLWDYFSLYGCPHFYTKEWQTKGRICTKTNKLYPPKMEFKGAWIEFCPFLELSFSDLISTLKSMIEESQREFKQFMERIRKERKQEK